MSAWLTGLLLIVKEKYPGKALTADCAETMTGQPTNW